MVDVSKGDLSLIVGNSKDAEPPEDDEPAEDDELEEVPHEPEEVPDDESACELLLPELRLDELSELTTVSVGVGVGIARRVVVVAEVAELVTDVNAPGTSVVLPPPDDPPDPVDPEGDAPFDDEPSDDASDDIAEESPDPPPDGVGVVVVAIAMVIVVVVVVKDE